MNFVIGLTDVEDYDGFVYENKESQDSDDIKISYNIKKASTDIEKDSIIWSLDTTLAVTKNMIKVWEHTIRRPHLNMIRIITTKNMLVPDYDHYDFGVSVINLIPMLPDYKILLTADDFSNVIETSEFGDMVLALHQIHNESGIAYQNTLEYAFHYDTTDLLKEYNYPYVLPTFGFDFKIIPRPLNSKGHKHSYDFIDWVNENKDALAAKGYTLDDPYCNIGVIRIGKLIGDPWEEYQKLQKYSRICRTSIVTVEE
jgi:hypothetical protein